MVEEKGKETVICMPIGLYTPLPNTKRGVPCQGAQTVEEIKEIFEAGFEYVCEKDILMFFRKRK